MTSDQSDGNGEALCFKLVVPLIEIGRGKRRASAASIVMKPLDEDQQARFDAEVQLLLADMVRQQLQIRRSEHVAR